jgi:hypothetical protein
MQITMRRRLLRLKPGLVGSKIQKSNKQARHKNVEGVKTFHGGEKISSCRALKDIMYIYVKKKKKKKKIANLL